MCPWDQIFRVLLEHFISEVVRNGQRDQTFRFFLVHFFINFLSKWLREQMFHHCFCAKVAAEAIAIFLLVYFVTDSVRK